MCWEKSMVTADRPEHKDLVFTYGGTVYPTTLCTSEILKAMESSEAGRDTIILASIPKSSMFFMLHKGYCHSNADNANKYNNSNNSNNSNHANGYY